jgi:hypothetical protein
MMFVSWSFRMIVWIKQSFSSCYVRAPTRAELQVTYKRVIPCFE